jgi:hypothetical protein
VVTRVGASNLDHDIRSRALGHQIGNLSVPPNVALRTDATPSKRDTDTAGSRGRAPCVS